MISYIAIDLTIACTTFVINDSTNLIYGRNFDWDIGSGMIAITNSMIEDFKAPDNAIDYSFEILKKVGSENRTQWSVVFDINNGLINFRTINDKMVREITLTDFDFSCGKDIQVLNI